MVADLILLISIKTIIWKEFVKIFKVNASVAGLWKQCILWAKPDLKFSNCGQGLVLNPDWPAISPPAGGEINPNPVGA